MRVSAVRAEVGVIVKVERQCLGALGRTVADCERTLLDGSQCRLVSVGVCGIHVSIPGEHYISAVVHASGNHGVRSEIHCNVVGAVLKPLAGLGEHGELHVVFCGIIEVCVCDGQEIRVISVDECLGLLEYEGHGRRREYQGVVVL